MTRGLVVLLLAVLCAMITAVSAYIAGTTTKSLMVRVMVSAVLAGSLGMIIGSWFQGKFSRRIESDNNADRHRVDIEISDDTDNNEWQPLDIAHISKEDSRVFPAHK